MTHPEALYGLLAAIFALAGSAYIERMENHIGASMLGVAWVRLIGGVPPRFTSRVRMASVCRALGVLGVVFIVLGLLVGR